MNTEKILIFELNWMGDILFSYPLLRALRRKYPDAYIQCVVVPRYSGLLVNNPWINDIHVLSDERGITSLTEKINFIKMIRKEGFDTCILLKPSRIKAFMAAFAGIKRRIGFAGKNYPVTETVEVPDPEKHRADRLLSLAGLMGIEEADGTYEYFLRAEDEEKAENIIYKHCGDVQDFIVINPGGNWDTKRWDADNFTRLSGKLLERFGNIHIFVTGANKDVENAETIISGTGIGRCHNIAGRTDINTLAALFKRSHLVVSADSGPLHLASACGAVTIGLFGPTSSYITGPRGKGRNIVISGNADCEIPCYMENCDKDRICMRSITVDQVYEQAEKVLEGKGL